MKSVSIFSIALALASVSQAVPNPDILEDSKLNLKARGYGPCKTDANCIDDWTCQSQWNGDEDNDAVKVCLPKRSLQTRGHGPCDNDQQCVDGWSCQKTWSGNEYVTDPTKVCLPKEDEKRSLGARGYGPCKTDENCISDWTCQSQWNGDEDNDAVKVCLPKRQLAARGYGPCDNDKQCVDGWKCKKTWSGNDYVTDPTKVCLPEDSETKRDPLEGDCKSTDECPDGEYCAYSGCRPYPDSYERRSEDEQGDEEECS